MSDQSDSQNSEEEQVHMSEGTSPSSNSDDGSKSTPSNLPKAATRARKKKTSECEDQDYVEVEDEATSKKKVVKKEYSTAAATKPVMKQKVPAKRAPMSKVRASTQDFGICTQRAGCGRKEKEREGQDDHCQSAWETLNHERL